MDKIGLVACILCAILFYFIQSSISEEIKEIKAIKQDISYIKVEQKALNGRLDVKELDKLNELKIAKNEEVLGDISCGSCHNSSDTALPIYKISMQEAISIVRFGNERTKAAGMPIYKSFNNGKDNFIADSGLKNRLGALYTDELLKTAKNKQ